MSGCFLLGSSFCLPRCCPAMQTSQSDEAAPLHPGSHCLSMVRPKAVKEARLAASMSLSVPRHGCGHPRRAAVSLSWMQRLEPGSSRQPHRPSGTGSSPRVSCTSESRSLTPFGRVWSTTQVPSPSTFSSPSGRPTLDSRAHLVACLSLPYAHNSVASSCLAIMMMRL
jgi:hypothetical protein